MILRVDETQRVIICTALIRTVEVTFVVILC